MRQKSKDLLEKLNKITEKPKDKFEVKPTLPDTNRFWKSVHESEINSLPKSYNPIKWNKEEDDGEVDYWTPIDRIYGGLGANPQKLIQKDGTQYYGKLSQKNRLVKGVDGNNFRSRCTVTADGRWFNNSGFPIDPPTNLEPEPKKTHEELEAEKQQKMDKEKAMLENLK